MGSTKLAEISFKIRRAGGAVDQGDAIKQKTGGESAD